MKAVIILPTYNERENITGMLTKLVSVMEKVKRFTYAILVVDDTSPDGTAELVKAFAKTHRDVHLLTGKKEGLGKALLRGMSYAIDSLDAEVIAQLDADLSHDPEALPEFFKKIAAGDDFVVGTRYIRGGSIPENWGIHRKIFSVVGNAVVRFGLGFPEVHDWTGGYRVFRKEYFIKAKEKMAKYSGYVYQIAFLHSAILDGAKVGEVPIHFTDRKYGRSKIAPLQYIRNVFLYVGRARLHQLRHGSFAKFAVVGTVGFIINTTILELAVRAGFHPAVGSAGGAECAIISNFFFNNGWTFRGKKIRGLRLIPKFLQFNATSLGALLIQSGTVAVGTHFFGENLYRLFYLIGVGIGLVWNYTMYSRVIWKNK
jgi:dolichol-phosphate mannosyltransferase